MFLYLSITNLWILFYPQVGELTFPKLEDAKLPITKPYHPASPQPSFFASWSSIFGPFCSSPTTLLLLSPLFLLHGQAFSALSAQAPTKKTWGYDVFGLFCFIMKSKNSQPKPAISIFAAGNCQRYESRYEKHQAPTQ